MTKNKLIEYLKTYSDCSIDQPFSEDNISFVARHKRNNKWFALIFKHEDRDIVNLKCEPFKADFLRKMYKNITAGYHMNKTHWNTVYLDGDISDELMYVMISDSFELTAKPAQNRKMKNRKN
ncbi:MAG: MmcQ/YjbR family DNA-binding protein [Clostridiales bacterium]|nr:MmcQ/YjbR family DNA-binding protein [Clostridiales bacterium]